jgi:hypothetical protein
MTLAMFHPFDQLAAKLLNNLMDDEDGAHDLSHIMRVWRNAKLIHREEGVWPTPRETHARWMMGEMRWITFPRSC